MRPPVGEGSDSCPAAVERVFFPCAFDERELIVTVLAAPKNFRREIRVAITVLRLPDVSKTAFLSSTIFSATA
jgi:hypothetical protein